VTPGSMIARLAAGADEAGHPVRSRRAVRLGGDRDLDPDIPEPSRARMPAAVLVPIVERDEGLTVILTLRTEHLNAHAGQVSFPGGRIEDHDADEVAAALRETEEEIGLPRHHVRVVGRLDDYETGTGFIVTPIVGLIRPPFPIERDEFEVADVFEVPLSFILEPANHELRSGVFGGRRRHYYVLPYEDRFIWGATAGMLINLYERLRD
jgi:8-oxo-dGTP pyrophosphatase MutT (NUDIX family)